MTVTVDSDDGIKIKNYKNVMYLQLDDYAPAEVDETPPSEPPVEDDAPVANDDDMGDLFSGLNPEESDEGGDDDDAGD